MSTLSNEEINNIRTSVDIVDVIGKNLSLQKRGKNYFCECPFHEDKTPSLSISPDMQIFTCFSCHRTGNVFNYLMEYEHLNFIEAVKMVAEMGGVKVDVNTKTKTINNKVHDVYNLSHKFYLNNINTTYGKKAKEYLKSRNIDEEVIKEFGIGLAINKRDALSNLLVKKEFNEKDLIASALVVKDERGYHDFFFDRIVFPLFDVSNQVVGYSGRIYENIDAPKYVNSKEHSLFKKGEFLYNYYKAKDECRKKNTVIITEGFLDVIRCHTIGVKNVIATMGTAFTKQHISLIKRLANNVILCFDGDSAGFKATYACSEELIKHNILPKIIILEDKLDPDDYILKKGKDKFLDKINSAISVTDFKLMYHKKVFDINQIEDKAKYTNKMIEELNKIEDEILREITIKKLSSEVDLDEEFLKQKLEKKEVKQFKEPKPIETSKYVQAQAGLIYYMLNDIEVIKTIDSKVVYFPEKNYRLLAQEIIYFYKKNNYINMADILNELNEELIRVIGFIETLGFKPVQTYEVIDDYIKAIEEKNIQEECIRLTKKISSTTDEEEKAKLSQKIINLLARREKDV